MSHEKTSCLFASSSQLVDSPALFLPSEIIDNFFIVDSDPPEDILLDLSLLTWITVRDVIEYFKYRREKVENDYQQSIQREKWKDHELYKKTLPELRQLCKNNNVSSKGNKHELVQSIAQQDEDGESEENGFYPDYDGDPSSLPKTVSNIRKLPIATLKYILKSHALSYCGSKDELVLRVFLLSHNRVYLCAYNQAKFIKEKIGCARKIIAEQVKEYLLNVDNLKRIRVNRSVLKDKSVIEVPENIVEISDLHQLFKCLDTYLDQHLGRDDKVVCDEIETSTSEENRSKTDTKSEELFDVGTRVKVLWTKDEIGDTGWRSGWYVAEVQQANQMLDQIDVVYISEPESVYTIDVTSMLASGKLQLSDAKNA